MSRLTILRHPDPRLRQKAQLVNSFDSALQKLIEDMFETMYEAPGVGLAANQVGIDLRLAVMDCSEQREAPIVMINPEVSDLRDLGKLDEGCLSVPDIQDQVPRYNQVHLKALDRYGKAFELDASGLLAQCIQHELDHLNGKLFVDYLSWLKRDRIRKKLSKKQRTG